MLVPAVLWVPMSVHHLLVNYVPLPERKLRVEEIGPCRVFASLSPCGP